MSARAKILLGIWYVLTAVVVFYLGYRASDTHWFVWVAIVWLVVAPVVAVIIGRGIRMADRKEGTGDKPDDDPPTIVPPDWTKQ